ncbi:unnamed protein product [Leuciscus chuanchicus]
MTGRALGRAKLLLVLSPVTHAVTVSVLIQVHRTPPLSSKLLGQLELSAASQANAKTNLIIISSNPAHYRLPNYPINSTSWESLFATQANVCSQISRQEDSSIVQTQGFDNAEQARLVTQGGRSSLSEWWKSSRDWELGAHFDCRMRRGSQSSPNRE